MRSRKRIVVTDPNRNLRASEGDLSRPIPPISLAAVCGLELEDLCAFDADNSMIPQEEYYGRVCLWRNKAALSQGCTEYVTRTAPSIVEPCLRDIEQFCLGVTPGYGQVHSCLQTRSSELSDTCKVALQQDSIRVADKLLEVVKEDISEESSSVQSSWESTKTKLSTYIHYLTQKIVNSQIESAEESPEPDDNIIKQVEETKQETSKN